MKPLKDRIIIKKEEFEKTEGGIFIPVSADPYNAPHPTGTVISVGTTVEEVKPGDRVIYSKNVGSEIELNGEKLFMILESHIIGIL